MILSVDSLATVIGSAVFSSLISTKDSLGLPKKIESNDTCVLMCEARTNSWSPFVASQAENIHFCCEKIQLHGLVV